MSKTKTRICLDCRRAGTAKDFAKGRRVCLKCHSERVERTRNKRAKLTLQDTQPKASMTGDPFASRDALSQYIKDNLNTAMASLDALIEVNQQRLDAAKAAGDSKAMHEASKALESTLRQKQEQVTRLMDKLQSMDELRLKSEKSKPVTFYLVQIPEPKNFAVQRQVPAEYWPDEKTTKAEVDL